MAHANRTPLQVSPAFLEKLKELQRKIRMATGNEKSLRSLTEDITKTPAFREMENTILRSGNINMDIKIRLDRRSS
jgi:hypothetical protein